MSGVREPDGIQQPYIKLPDGGGDIIDQRMTSLRNELASVLEPRIDWAAVASNTKDKAVGLALIILLLGIAAGIGTAAAYGSGPVGKMTLNMGLITGSACTVLFSPAFFVIGNQLRKPGEKDVIIGGKDEIPKLNENILQLYNLCEDLKKQVDNSPVGQTLLRLIGRALDGIENLKKEAEKQGIEIRVTHREWGNLRQWYQQKIQNLH